MSYYIIIRGPAGIGKSTIVVQLSKLLKGYNIAFDKILKENDLDYVVGEKCVPVHKFLAANKIVIPKAKEKLERGHIVIFDGNFYHKLQIEDLISNLQFPYFVFTLKSDLNECFARNKTRSYPLDEQAIEDVFKLVSRFDYGVLIDTNAKTIYEVVQEIIKYLRAHKINRVLQ